MTRMRYNPFVSSCNLKNYSNLSRINIAPSTKFKSVSEVTFERVGNSSKRGSSKHPQYNLLLTYSAVRVNLPKNPETPFHLFYSSQKCWLSRSDQIQGYYFEKLIFTVIVPMYYLDSIYLTFFSKSPISWNRHKWLAL